MTIANFENSNRDRIISVAAELFLTHGIKNTSIDKIVRESGVAKSNIYYHFKNKDEVILAVVERQITWFQIEVLSPIFEPATEMSTLDILDQYFKGMSDFLSMNECKKGCPFAFFIIQVSQTHEIVRLRISEFFSQVSKDICNLVQTGIDKGEIKKNIDPAQTAQFIFTLIEGAMLMATTHRDVSIIHNTGELLRIFLQE